MAFLGFVVQGAGVRLHHKYQYQLHRRWALHVLFEA